MSEAPPVTTEDEFRDHLNTLLETARENDIPMKGSWRCRRTADPSDYEVLITEVVPRARRQGRSP